MIPIIGILGEIDNEKTLTLKHAYIPAIEKSGGLALVLPYTDDDKVIGRFIQLCDGFVFSGGADISPTIYGEDVKPTCGTIQPCRDDLDVRVMKKAIASQKPILCICRGMQLLNAVLGGTLYQDLPSEFVSDIVHRKTKAEHFTDHTVNVLEGTPLCSVAEGTCMRVNSYHHQAIKQLAPALKAMALADDGLIEAVYCEGEGYIRGYQWHPERLFDADADNRAIFADFVQACKGEN